MNDYIHNNSCRICGNKDLIPILDLGMQPLANSFLKIKDINKEKFFPLKLYFCKTCSLVQLLDIVNPKLLFENYAYNTGTSPALVSHLKELAKTSLKYTKMDDKSLIIDIGCNDGTLLRHYKEMGYWTVGIDPAKNINPDDITIEHKYFGKDTAQSIKKKYGSAWIITATNVFAHIDNLNDIIDGVKILLKDDGVFIIEVPYVIDMIKNTEFDTIYHEHLSYFSLTALNHLFIMNDMQIVDVKNISNHGGSLRIFVKKDGKKSRKVRNMIKEESKIIWDINFYNKFTYDVSLLKSMLKAYIYISKILGLKIIGYGATAKGNTLLNYCGLDSSKIDFISDRTPSKIGLYSPGMHIPIIDEKELPDREFNYILLLAWNYKDNILEKEKKLRNKGVKFIIPIPEVEII